MTKSLTKMDIIKAIATSNGYTQNQAADIIDTLMEIIIHSLETGDDVLISGFGKFCVREKNARRGRNPATGESMIIEQRRIVTFQCSDKLMHNFDRTL